MNTALDVLVAARSKLGVKEMPPGSNQVEFNTWAGVAPGPWCAAFASWALAQGGALDVAKFVYCPTGVAEYRNDGRFGGSPRIGAVIFFQWAGQDRPCHVGLVEAVRSDGSVVTIEGNTDIAGGGSGGQVMRHVRRGNIVGYGYPRYSALAPPEVQKVNPDFDPPLPVVSVMANPNGPGSYGVGPDGGIFAFAGAPTVRGPNGKDYFRGRVAAKIQPGFGGRPVIVATSGEVYGPDF